MHDIAPEWKIILVLKPTFGLAGSDLFVRPAPLATFMTLR